MTGHGATTPVRLPQPNYLFVVSVASSCAASSLTLNTSVVGGCCDPDAVQDDLPSFPSVLPRNLRRLYGLSSVFLAPRRFERLLVCGLPVCAWSSVVGSDCSRGVLQIET